MRALRTVFQRLAGVFTKDRQDADLREELASHLEMHIAENIRRGMDPAGARRQALLASGGLTQAAEAVRAQRGFPWIESIAADLRYAARALRHNHAFTFVAVLTLALGIGANTAIFSVVRGVLLKPLPHRDGDRLVYLRQSMDGPAGGNLLFSVPEIRDFRDGTKAFGNIAEYSPATITLVGDNDATRINVGLVTGNFFEVMGLSPILGRPTQSSDDGPGVPPVMILTYEFWMKRFGGDSAIVGRQVRTEGGSIMVIGVLQPAPYFPDPVDVFTNMVVSPHHLSALMVQGRTHRMTEMIARLAPGVTLGQAEAQVGEVYARMQLDDPSSYDTGAHQRVTVVPFKEAIGDRARLPLLLLTSAAAFVLIISAANVINLTLMRGIRRTHELVARAALGAGVGRLRRLLVVENLVLALSGAGLGVLLAFGGVDLLTALATRYSPRASEIRLDGTVLGFALGLAVVLALLLSMVAVLPREGTLSAWLAAGGRRLSGSGGKHRLQRSLVVAQVAVSVVLLAGAGLLTRTMLELSHVETGLATEQVLTMDVALFSIQRFSPAADADAKSRYEQMRTSIQALPGVNVVGLGSTAPLRASMLTFELKAEGQSNGVGEAIPRTEVRTASPEYFRAAGIPLLKGREFAGTDLESSPRVVIVNQRLVDRFFPDRDPIGRQIAFTGEVLRFSPVNGDWRTIVGVVGNTQDGGLEAKPRLVVFMPFTQMVAVQGGLVVRAEGNPEALVSSVTRIVRGIAPLAPIENVLTVAQIKDQSIAPRRLNAILVSSFGLLALLIAAVGIAGVLAFSVSARTNEIGLRMSLGADRSRVLRMILGEGGLLVGLGLIIGIGAALLSAGAMRGLLFGVAPHDPVTFATVGVTMTLIGVVACLIPALRAARVDPSTAMRS